MIKNNLSKLARICLAGSMIGLGACGLSGCEKEKPVETNTSKQNVSLVQQYMPSQEYPVNLEELEKENRIGNENYINLEELEIENKMGSVSPSGANSLIESYGKPEPIGKNLERIEVLESKEYLCPKSPVKPILPNYPKITINEESFKLERIEVLESKEYLCPKSPVKPILPNYPKITVNEESFK